VIVSQESFPVLVIMYVGPILLLLLLAFAASKGRAAPRTASARLHHLGLSGPGDRLVGGRRDSR